MSTKKNTSLAIGAFIVGAVLLVFVALIFFSGGRLFAEKDRVIMYFSGSVQGLQVGAPIKLKGVVLGQINDIQINFQSDNKTIVTAVTADLVMERISSEGAEIDSDFIVNAVDNGLRAQLNYQSFLTGLLYVELDFYPDSELKLYELEEDYAEIPTIGTSFEEISDRFQELDLKGLVNNVNDLAEQISTIVGDGQVQKTLTNFNQLVVSLEATSNNLNGEITQMSGQMTQTLSELNTLIGQLNTATPKIAETLDKSLQELQASLSNFDDATANVNYLLSDDSILVNQISRTLEDVSRSAQAFRSLSETLEQQPEALLRGRKLTEGE